MSRLIFIGRIILFLALAQAIFALDEDEDGLNDIWEILYTAQNLTAYGDDDGDGKSNAEESKAGTDPYDADSFTKLNLENLGSNSLNLAYSRIGGKRYRLQSSVDLSDDSWSTFQTHIAPWSDENNVIVNMDVPTRFWRLAVDDIDADSDGLFDAEEIWLGFDPSRVRSGRFETPDMQRVTSGLGATSVVSVAALDANMTERWPDPGVFVVRRSGGLKPIFVNINLSGSASRNVDYTAYIQNNTVLIPMGETEVTIELMPFADNDVESDETIILTALASDGYNLGPATNASVTLINETDESPPSAKECARFLIQASFGPDQDSMADADEIPENVEALMMQGFEPWIDEQFTRPIGLLQPWTEWQEEFGQGLQIYGRSNQMAWWNRVMGVPKLRPDAIDSQLPDPLRQRVAFALSEILVVSDRPEALAVERVGLANYYDIMVTHAFGNFRDLLFDVSMHPVMGIYLSHLGNRKADPVNKIYPDENFAREIMQLFSIGLWRLNQDGSRYLSDGTDTDPDGNVVPVGLPIATYGNNDITELAKVFTGMSFGNNANFQLYPRDFTQPMKIWDAEHDLEPKSFLGHSLPAREASAGNTGTAGLADVNAAIDHLFQHPNTGPFLARQLIQRMVTSNPSAAYVGRVAAAFANNGSGERGDMKAVIKAILLDTEARDPAMMDLPTWGKLREPLLKVVNFATAFNASAPGGWFALDQMALAHAQDPMNSPSVFNFFLPSHSPQGAITEMGLVAPEFQIVNASTAVTGANYFWNHTLGGLHIQGSSNATNAVSLNLAEELLFIVPVDQIEDDVPDGPALDPDPLLRRLDLMLTGGTLSPRQFKIIREAMLRINPPTWMWHRERFRLAVYLICTSADFNVMR